MTNIRDIAKICCGIGQLKRIRILILKDVLEYLTHRLAHKMCCGVINHSRDLIDFLFSSPSLVIIKSTY